MWRPRRRLSGTRQCVVDSSGRPDDTSPGVAADPGGTGRHGVQGEAGMTRHYGGIAFTDSVEAAQERYGSRNFYARRARRSAPADGPDPLTPDVVGFLAGRDGFYLATV